MIIFKYFSLSILVTLLVRGHCVNRLNFFICSCYSHRLSDITNNCSLVVLKRKIVLDFAHELCILYLGTLLVGGLNKHLNACTGTLLMVPCLTLSKKKKMKDLHYIFLRRGLQSPWADIFFPMNLNVQHFHLHA